MSRFALGHMGSTKHLPPKDAVMALVEETPNHFYWLGEFYDDGLDRAAIYPWKPPAEPRTLYVVPRLLWVWANDAIGIKRLRIENTCKLYTCVNPAHWRSHEASHVLKSARIAPGYSVRLIRHLNEVTLTHGIPAPVHIFTEGAAHAMCGAKPIGSPLPADTEVTCPRCLKSWQALGRPFLTEECPKR